MYKRQGRHLRTLSAHRGTPLYTFGYDPSSRALTSITDHVGNVTSISRTAQTVTIRSPFGQVTQLGLDPNGHVQTVTNPQSEVTQFATQPDGLLTDMSDPRGLTHHFEYDGATSGRLALDVDGAPGSPGTRLSIGEFVGGWLVEHRSPEDRLTNYVVDRRGSFPNRSTVEKRTISHGFNAELRSTIDIAADGSQSTEQPDGTKVTVLATAPDPRWGTRASFASSVRTDVGFPTTTHSMTVARTRTSTLSAAADPFSVAGETITTTLSGANLPNATTTAVYAPTPSPTWTMTSPAGRQSRSTLDALERVTKLEALGTDPVALHPIEYHYDLRGRLDRITHGPRVYTTTYDAITGWPTATTDPANLGVTYGLRDANGRPLEVELPGGRSLELSYDANGNVTSIIPPNRPAHAYGLSLIHI